MRLVAAALVVVAAVLGWLVGAGGGDFVPARPADPCRARPGPPVPPRLEPLAERVVLAGLDATACDLGISRERLILSLDADRAEALKAGLSEGLGRLNLPKVSAVLPEALDLADLPGIAREAIEAVPDSVVDGLLPTRDLLRRTISELDFRQVLSGLDDPVRLEPALRDAILAAAADQIIDRLT